MNPLKFKGFTVSCYLQAVPLTMVKAKVSTWWIDYHFNNPCISLEGVWCAYERLFHTEDVKRFVCYKGYLKFPCSQTQLVEFKYCELIVNVGGLKLKTHVSESYHGDVI